MENNLLNDENTSSVSSSLSEILKKYGLDEDIEKIAKKLEIDETTNLEIISNASDDFSENKISEKDLTTYLQKNLNIQEEKAGKIAAEIRDNITPILKTLALKKISDKPVVAIKPEEIITKIPPTISEEIKTGTINTDMGKTGTSEIPKKPKKTLQEKFKKANILEKDNKFIPKPKQSSGADSYREPIE